MLHGLDAGEGVPLADLTGRFTVVDGCLRFDSGTDRYVVALPEGASLQDGVARVGDHGIDLDALVTVGGGEVSAGLPALTSMPDACDDPAQVWLVTEILR